MCGALQKTKEGFGYKYVPEEEIQAKVTAGMKKYGLMLYPNLVPGTLNVIETSYEKYDKKLKANKLNHEVIVSAEMKYVWVNVDNPTEQVEVPWAIIGQMEDAAQAFGAGATYCNRYFLMKSLQLATTDDDPDNYRSKQKDAENAELKEAINDVISMGNKLIASGAKPADIATVVAKYNDGNGNPKQIQTLEICDAIIKELKSMEKAAKKPSNSKKKEGDKNVVDKQ